MSIFRTTPPSKVPGYKNLLAFIDWEMSAVPVVDITETLILSTVLRKLSECENLSGCLTLAKVANEIDTNGHVFQKCLAKAKSLAKNNSEMKMVFVASTEINADRLFNEHRVVTLKEECHA